MGQIRRAHSAEFKTKVALAALRGDRTLAQLSSEFAIHSHQVVEWKKQALASLPEAFSRRKESTRAHDEAVVENLYSQIGRLKVELDWLKKKSGLEH